MKRTLDDLNKELQFRLQVVSGLEVGFARGLNYLSELRHLQNQATRLVAAGKDKVVGVLREIDPKSKEVSACADALSLLLADQKDRVDFLELAIEEAEWVHPAGQITFGGMNTLASDQLMSHVNSIQEAI